LKWTWRAPRWGAFVLIGLAAVGGLYALLDRLAGVGPEQGLDHLILPVLSLSLVGLALALTVVLVRNLVVLIVERKRGILGSRLRSKLVFFFLALVLAPALVLFVGSAQVIKQSVDAVASTPLEELTRRSGSLVEEWKSFLREQALDLATSIAADVRAGRSATEDQIRERTRRWQQRPELVQIRVVVGTRVVADLPVQASWVDASHRGEMAGRLDALVAEVRRDGRAATRLDHVGEGLLAHAAVPLDLDDGRSGVVSVGIVVPKALTGNLEGVDQAERVYRQFRVNRRQLVRLYLTLIGLVFLATLFAATWMGLYLARRITGPIQELAVATREIATGNLDVRVRAEIGDEIGMLVEAFNEMAGELQESREVITRSTADLRRSNRALDERRRYIETLLGNLSTAVLSLDSDGRVTTANRAVRGMLGLDLTPGDDAAEAFRRAGLTPLAELLEPGDDGPAEHVRRDLSLDRPGAARQVTVHVSQLRGAAGERLGTLVIVDDLTELLRAQKTAAWREVARRIAHEIKNPLTPIQLAAQRLRKKFAEGATDLGQVLPEATASIEREVGVLKRLVDEFSQFARLPEVAPREVELVGVVESALALYRGLGDVQWDVQVDPAVGRVSVDPDQIRRVLVNLVDNAVAATQARGTIRVHARRIAAERVVRLEVADDGPGVDPAHQDRLFTPDFSTKKRGTGLGLAIVYKIVKDHRGTIRLERNEPRGARFVLDLPA
jgi:two-component system nitrogen regulation sensor histidine kinase NtrY